MKIEWVQGKEDRIEYVFIYFVNFTKKKNNYYYYIKKNILIKFYKKKEKRIKNFVFKM